MKEEEFRVGIYVYYNEHVVKIDRDKMEDLFSYHGLMKIEKCKPIPTTERFLSRMGLEKMSEGKYRLIGDAFIETERKFVMINNHIIGMCDYIHKLQNLYFDATGKELTITAESRLSLLCQEN